MMTTDDDQGALLDVAANTLAVLIMVTVFSLSAVRDALPVRPDPDAISDPVPPISFGDRGPFRPISSYFVFLEGKMFKLDGEAVFALIAADPGPKLAVESSQGQFDFLPDPVGSRDADLYSFRFEPDEAYVAALPEFDSEAADRLVADARARWTSNGTAPTFVVYQSGMDSFVPVHDQLNEGGLMPWRWVAMAEGESVRLSRSLQAHRNSTIYW